MILVLLLSAVLAATAGAVLRLGVRDGWLRRARPAAKPHAVSCGDAAHFTHVGIVELLDFAPLRRTLGYRAANGVMALLAARLASGGVLRIGSVGRTAIEFLFSAADTQEAEALLAQVRAELEQPVESGAVRFEPAVAIAFGPVGADAMPDAFVDAISAGLAEAREAPNRIALVETIAPSVPDGEDALLRDLAEAIAANRLDLHYMPKLRLRDETIAGAEALCRWTHPLRGPVPPDLFIRLAEQGGLIGQLTLWALGRAIEDQDRLRGQGIDVAFDVNMSARLICDRAFCDRVIARITEGQNRIGLEITESGAIDDADLALENLGRFVEAGVHIAIDDFGTGLASLGYLRNLPAHELKIDQMFVKALTTTHRDPLLVRSAIEIGHALEMEVTAEGVEDEIALALLRVMRCDNVQGFHVSRALPIEQFTLFMRNRLTAAADDLSLTPQKHMISQHVDLLAAKRG